MLRALPFFLSCLCLSAVRAAEDEVHFKTKTYKQSTALQNRSYSASAYAPAAVSQSIGAPLATPKAEQWPLFSKKTSELSDKTLTDASTEKGEPYKQGQPISVPTIHADAKSAPEAKPLIDAGKKLADGTYQAPKPSNEKNPMLEPRQSIKAPE